MSDPKGPGAVVSLARREVVDAVYRIARVNRIDAGLARLTAKIVADRAPVELGPLAANPARRIAELAATVAKGPGIVAAATDPGSGAGSARIEVDAEIWDRIEGVGRAFLVSEASLDAAAEQSNAEQSNAE